MYSPKIKEDLIPVLYQLAKQQKIPMTLLVDQFVRGGLKKQKAEGATQGLLKGGEHNKIG